MRFEKDNGALVFFRKGEQVRIEPWGKNSYRVRAGMRPKFTGSRWALTEEVEEVKTQILVEEVDHWAMRIITVP